MDSSHLILICISLIMSDVEHLSICFLAICMSSLEKCWFMYFFHFWLGCLFFWHWIVRLCILGLILCQFFHFLLFSPILKISFHLVYSFLCCVKSFKFNQAVVVYFCFLPHYSRKCVIEELALIHVINCYAYVFLLEFYSFWSYI